MNAELYNDWANKRYAAFSSRIDKIKERRRKRNDLMIRVLVPTGVSFVVIGGFFIVPFFPLVFLICCFLIAVGLCALMHLDEIDNKKIMKILESTSDTTNPRFLPPSIRDTFNS